PDAGYFGGEIRPWFGAGVPHWVKQNQIALAGMLCLRDVGPISRRLGPREFPYGPNMAVSREALALASFDEQVGRKGDQQIRGSEDSLFRSLQQRGIPGVWVPAAKVYHYIPRSRANLKYLWNYYHQVGRRGVALSSAGKLHSHGRFLTAGLRMLTETC